jgi:tetratricopeptide (TPR) repeat protein
MAKKVRMLVLLPVTIGLSFLAPVSGVLCSSTGAVFAKLGGKGKSTVEPSQENLDIGMQRYKNKDVDGAIDSFLQAVYFARNSYNPDAYYWLGVCYFDKKLDAKAIDALNKHSEQTIKPSPEAHVLLAQIYLRNDRLREAENEANIAMGQYPGGRAFKAHNVLGLIKAKQGLFPSAEYQFLDALGDQPWHYTEAWMNYAENFMKEKEWGKAVIQLRNIIHSKVLLKDVDYQKIYLDIGICLLAKGDHQGAIDNWHEVLNINPDNSDAHLQLAMILDSENHISAAIKEYKDFVRLSEDATRVASAKDQIAILEQKLAPQVEPPPVKPSPYMREKKDDTDGTPALQERIETKEKETLSRPDAVGSGF